MKIVKLVAENIKKLKAVLIEPYGNVVKITGDNEQGKTTVLDCIWWALCGNKNIQDKPIRDGEKKGKITVDIGDLIVTRKFTESGSTLEVTNKEGAVYKSPQAILDNIVGTLSFDPLKFSRDPKSVQVETLLRLVKLNHDHAKLSRIAAIPFVESPSPIADIESARLAVHEKRTEINSKIKTYQGQLVGLSDVVKCDKIDVESLLAKKESIRKQLNNLYLANVEHNKQLRAKYNKDVELEREDNAKWNLQQGIRNRTITDVNEHLTALRDLGYPGLEVELWIKTLPQPEPNRIDLTTIEPDYITERPDDTSLVEIDKDLSDANANNIKATAWESKQRIEAVLDSAKIESTKLTDTLEAIQAYKENLISEAKFPIAGMGFNSDGVTIDNIPFDQCSSSQKIKVSVAVAMALNPKLRVIRIDDGSLIGPSNMKIIEDLAKDNDYQIWMEIVDTSGKIGIFIEDGEVKA